MVLDDFMIAFLDDHGAIGPAMDAKDVMGDGADAQAAVAFFARAMADASGGFENLNVRVGNYPPVTVAWQPIDDSAAVATLRSGDGPTELLLILTRRDRTNEPAHAAAFKEATKGLYRPEVIDVMLGDIAATGGPVVIVARPPSNLSPKTVVALDRTGARLASAFLSRP